MPVESFVLLFYFGVFHKMTVTAVATAVSEAPASALGFRVYCRPMLLEEIIARDIIVANIDGARKIAQRRRGFESMRPTRRYQ